MGERIEALMRIFVAIVTGIFLEIWNSFLIIGAVFHWIFVLITGRRIKSLARFSNMYASVQYTFVRYIYFSTNDRPFPFNKFPKEMDKLDMKKLK